MNMWWQHCRRQWAGFLTRPVVLLLLPVSVTAAQGAEIQRVLVVHSFVNAAPPFTTHSTAFESALSSALGKRVDLDEVSLDVARYATLDMEEALVELMRKRQAKWQPDLVVPIGSPAGVFVARYREQLFPATTPIIYTGMDQRRLPAGALQQNATFVGESFDFPGMLDDILQVSPATTNLAVVIGASPLELYWKEVLAREFARFTNRLSFTWFNELSFEQMLERAAALPPRSYILLVLLMRDVTGVTHNADEALKRLHEVANAPISSIFQNQLGLGVVGGRLYQAELEGLESARLAVRILHGESASSFPPRIIGPLAPRYDWRELQRWKIDPERLRPGSEILFRVPTLWERYRVWFIAGISVSVVQVVLLFGLAINQGRRRRITEALAESESRLRAVLASAAEGILSFNGHGIIESINAATEKLFGYAEAELVSQDVRVIMPALFRDEDARSVGATTGQAGMPKLIGVGRELSGRRKDGSEFPMELSVSELVLAGRRVFTGFVRDITERKQAEQAAREYSGRLIQAEEAERARLARELHDDITQRLACLAIETARIERRAPGTNLGAAIRQVRDGLVRLSEDVHSLSYKLHPAVLQDLGLADAVRAECERFSQQESISVEVNLEQIPASIPQGTGLCLFRVTQEALRNVARHAHATAAAVSLRPLDGGLQLAISDSGVGFDPRQQRHRHSLGHAGMRERVRSVGGDLDIESTLGHGTSIVAWVPMKGDAA
jgi:PAS domain S-box-containing protein